MVPNDHAWLVDARNRIQSLMLQVLQQWEVLEASKRQTAAAVAFSLWRAVFLVVEVDDPIEKLDAAAKELLGKVVKTNTVTFGDDRNTRPFSGLYYVTNATMRLTDLTGHYFAPLAGSPIERLQDSWEEAFRVLADLLAADVPDDSSA